MSKDDQTPAATTAAGQDLIRHTTEAVEAAHGELVAFLRETVGDELNGRQIRGVASGMLQIVTPLLRAGCIRDLAEAMEANPEVSVSIAQAIREAADQVHGLYRTQEVSGAGS